MAIKVCKEDGCSVSYFSGSRWDEIRAHHLGWFSSRWKPDVWCPKHVPAGVQEWRANQKAKRNAQA